MLNEPSTGLDQPLDALGVQGHRVAQEAQLEVWVKLLADGSRALGLFNRGESVMPVRAYFRNVGVRDAASASDLYEKRRPGVFNSSFTAQVPKHGVVLPKVKWSQGGDGWRVNFALARPKDAA